ncbi:hypothetical protein SLEP1_g5748 [Rubroshorea leprosula]|uniref:RRM domain-containing protein n=1 Tax=Rubroshorea leprosula TaxID=152421 RepID=A0AAV5HXA1_9ROSI|nr:hypothetical protein SLEP1_g5748 [Rubroshorea leprosula]
MRRYSPPSYNPPRRGYGGRERSPPRRGYGGRGGGGGYGRRREQNQGSLLVRNIPLDCRPEELRVPFERFGHVRDVYIPKDYYTGERLVVVLMGLAVYMSSSNFETLLLGIL